jgi:hypothetical protein
MEAGIRLDNHLRSRLFDHKMCKNLPFLNEFAYEHFAKNLDSRGN